MRRLMSVHALQYKSPSSCPTSVDIASSCTGSDASALIAPSGVKVAPEAAISDGAPMSLPFIGKKGSPTIEADLAYY